MKMVTGYLEGSSQGTRELKWLFKKFYCHWILLPFWWNKLVSDWKYFRPIFSIQIFPFLLRLQSTEINADIFKPINKETDTKKYFNKYVETNLLRRPRRLYILCHWSSSLVHCRTLVIGGSAEQPDVPRPVWCKMEWWHISKSRSSNINRATPNRLVVRP